MISRPLLAIALLCSLEAAAAESCKHIEHSFDATGLERLALEVGVGELRVESSDDGQVHVAIEVCPRGGFLPWRRHSAEAAALQADQKDARLALVVNGEKYEEEWTVRMPAGLALDADIGIGAVSLTGLRGNIQLDLGIGDLEISGTAGDYGRVNGDVGIGDFTVQAPDGNASNTRALISASGEWVADGSASISADIGIGGGEVRLD